MSDQSRASADAQEEHAGSPTGLPQEKLDTATEKEQHEQEQNTVEKKEEEESQHDQPEEGEDTASAPPLPDEVPPPLPDEAPPSQINDDGWEPVWDATSQAYYFYNRLTGLSQWENPRVSEQPAAPGTEPTENQAEPPRPKSPMLGGYNPAIHGSYDPTASYAQQYEETQELKAPMVDPAAAYAAAGTFNRFTGRWQAQSINPENHNDENKSHRQMNAYFDVDAAANSHDGRSLRAERSAKKLSKKELKEFKEKRREKKEEKRRAWLRD